MNILKAISTKTTKGIQTGTVLKCVDNTGAKVVEVISVKGFSGARGRHPRAGVGDVVQCAVKKGTQKIKHEVVRAVVVRQAMPYRRPQGNWIKFQDNAVILLDEKNEPRGKEIKDVIAKECVERFPTVGKIARTIV